MKGLLEVMNLEVPAESVATSCGSAELEAENSKF